MLLKQLLTILSIAFITPLKAGVISCAAGIAFYGSCQTACNVGYVGCMSASGLVAGTTGPVGWWAWLTSAAGACSATQGLCMAGCATQAAGMCAAPVP